MAANIRERAEQRVRIKKEDVLGSMASFSIVFLIGLPAAIPFLLVDEPWRALRFSNCVLLALLFLTGYCFGKSTLSHPLLIGSGVTILGVALVVAAIALGG
jgi:VIT1/CCC1 family predicted Fe2+/Mn2+ transporter